MAGSYAVQWIGYYLTKYLAGPLGKLREGLKSFNDKAGPIAQKWAQRIGKVMSVVVRLGATALRVGGKLFSLLEKIPDKFKTIFGAGGLIAAIIKSGPLGWIVAAIFGVIALLDDLDRYQNGKSSMFAPMWDRFNEFKEGFAESDAFEGIKTAIDNIGTALGELFSRVDWQRFGEIIGDTVGAAFEAIAWIVQGIRDIIDYFTDSSKVEEMADKYMGQLAQMEEAGMPLERMLFPGKIQRVPELETDERRRTGTRSRGKPLGSDYDAE